MSTITAKVVATGKKRDAQLAPQSLEDATGTSPEKGFDREIPVDLSCNATKHTVAANLTRSPSLESPPSGR